MSPAKHILWADDEIEYLKPHILFLKQHGYSVTPVVAGSDVIDMLKKDPSRWDVILLDENMPGLTGLETLRELRLINPDVPVVMITKNEEEGLMDKAVGNQISDYLLKPVNPRQILLTLKKLLDAQELIAQQVTTDYHREFLDISAAVETASSFDDWTRLYTRLTRRAVDLVDRNTAVYSLLESQHEDAQKAFFRYVRTNYQNWIDGDDSHPLLSHQVLEKYAIPELHQGLKPVLILMDNFRLDQWLTVKPLFTERFDIAEATLFCSLLPTVTQYARNSLFSGLLPAQIQKRYPELWIDEESESGKNLNESVLTRNLLDRNGLASKTLAFHKANDSLQLNRIITDFGNDKADFTIIVVNFIDILSHSKTDSAMIRELASNDAAYRSITLSWFTHSPFTRLLDAVAASGRPLFFTTDHGSQLVNSPLEIVTEKDVKGSLRYKVGRNMAFPQRDVFAVHNPSAVGLPAISPAYEYIFAPPGKYFVFPQNKNLFATRYRGTYQHGGISMEEMLVPFITLSNGRNQN